MTREELAHLRTVLHEIDVVRTEPRGEIHSAANCEMCLDLLRKNKLMALWAHSPESSFQSSSNKELILEVQRLIAHAIYYEKVSREVGDVLKEQEIPYCYLKGYPLSGRLYGENFLRGTGDVDILVSPDRFQEAWSALHDGFRISVARYFGTRPSKLRYYYNVVFTMPGGMVLELHRKFSNLGCSGRYIDKYLDQRVKVNDRPVLPFPVEASYLLEHMGKSCLRVTLLHYVDMAVVLNLLSETEYEQFLFHLKQRQITKLFGVVVAILLWMNMKLPEHIVRETLTDQKRLDYYTRQVMSHLVRPFKNRRKIREYFDLHDNPAFFVARALSYQAKMMIPV